MWSGKVYLPYEQRMWECYWNICQLHTYVYTYSCSLRKVVILYFFIFWIITLLWFELCILRMPSEPNIGNTLLTFLLYLIRELRSNLEKKTFGLYEPQSVAHSLYKFEPYLITMTMRTVLDVLELERIVLKIEYLFMVLTQPLRPWWFSKIEILKF